VLNILNLLLFQWLEQGGYESQEVVCVCVCVRERERERLTLT